MENHGLVPDPQIGLAMAMQSAPGRFALLLGSGLSIAAGIPTGWDVVSDIARRLAAAEGEVEPIADPIAWYTDRYGDSPDYSGLLEAVAPTGAQRRDLLSAYIVPTAEEEESGMKLPTAAHRAIAQLVRRGTVRVIVTTNFDRLLEHALQTEGIDPVVIASAEAAAGATPIAHSRCTIIKVHGDYLDPNIKNTVGELSSYEPPVDALLDRVFDDYGLVVCGWSGTWDAALRHAIERCPTRRYATYWTGRGAPSPEARVLIAHREAEFISIASADGFFESLTGKIEALDDLGRRTAPGTDLVTAEAKRYLPDPIHRIRLHDLVMDAGTRALSAIDFDGSVQNPQYSTYLTKVAEIEAAASDLIAATTVLGEFADRPDHEDLLQRLLVRLAGPTESALSGVSAFIALRGYPALLAMYSTGLSATSAENWSTVACAASTKVARPQSNSADLFPFADAFSTWHVLEAPAIASTFDEARRTPLSDYLHAHFDAVLRPHLRLSAERFEQIFDEWEYLVGVVIKSEYGRVPGARWMWRIRHRDRFPDRALVAAESALLRRGCFEGNPALLSAAQLSLAEDVQHSGMGF